MHFPDNQLAVALFGEVDAHLKLIEKRLNVVLYPRGNTVTIAAPTRKQAQQVKELLTELYQCLERGETVDIDRVQDCVQAVEEDAPLDALLTEKFAIETPKKLILPRNVRQVRFIESLIKSDLLFGVGPAGTGKTYLAVAMAVQALMQNRVTRIVLTRPAVEAGENLGFLPGDLQAKVDPYLRPLYDALHDMVGGPERIEKMVEKGQLEIAPLAYMRGRTLDDAAIILDEGQNTTPQQMKMFLTRLGKGSKVIVSGDVTQIDLPSGQRSGLVEALSVLKGVEGVSMTFFRERDVVRHPLVQRIVVAYDQARLPASHPSTL
ncbi:MAG: PhoH family protein [Magnetococcales bacterium]|nr:PhoH family protein [Magnetococcales bacterium]